MQIAPHHTVYRHQSTRLQLRRRPSLQRSHKLSLKTEILIRNIATSVELNQVAWLVDANPKPHRSRSLLLFSVRFCLVRCSSAAGLHLTLAPHTKAARHIPAQSLHLLLCHCCCCCCYSVYFWMGYYFYPTQRGPVFMFSA